MDHMVLGRSGISVSKIGLGVWQASAEWKGDDEAIIKAIRATIEPDDAMIAGIARVHGEKVLTRNQRHFQGIEGVNVKAY